MTAHQYATPAAPVAMSLRALTRSVLQRKCACGGTPGPTGECEECRRKRLLDLQAKLTVNQPGDIYEQEADQIADHVMRVPAQHAVRRAPLTIQRFSGNPGGPMGAAAPASVDAALASPGSPLQPALRQDMEQRFGYDFSRVRVHAGAAAEQSARDVHAQAYTVGHDMVFGAGRFAPDTPQGRRLLAHELTHTVQQSGGGRTATRPDPAPVHAFPTAPILARACDAAQCPGIEFPIGVFVPSWQLAEKCLQDNYEKSFPNSTIGFNKNWVGLRGRNSREQATIDCFRSYYTAKGYESDEARRERRRSRGQGEGTDIPLERQGAAQTQAEPDIFDFTRLTIMEITTPSGLGYRSTKVLQEVKLATELMHECSIDAPNQWSIGFWEPEPCYQIVGAGQPLAGKLFFHAQRVGGVLVYVPTLDVTREVVALATALAAAGAAASAAGGGSSSTAQKALKEKPPYTLPFNPAAAAVIAAIAAFLLWAARFFKPLKLAAIIGTILGMLLRGLGFGLAVASDKGDYAGDDGGKGAGAGPGPGGGAAGGPARDSKDQPGGPQTGPPTGTTTVPVPGKGPPAGTTTLPPVGTTVTPGKGTTSSQGGGATTAASGGAAAADSLLDQMLRLLLKLLGIDPAVAARIADAAEGGAGGQKSGPSSGDKVPVPPITSPPSATTKPPAKTGTTSPGDQATGSATSSSAADKKPPPARQSTSRTSKARQTSQSSGKTGQTTAGAGKTGQTTARAGSEKAPEKLETFEVNAIEGLDLRTAKAGWWSFVFFDLGKPTEKLVLLGLIDIRQTADEMVFEFRSGEGECSRAGCNGGRNNYNITLPRRSSSTSALNGVVVFSKLPEFFPHEPNLADLAAALDDAGRAGEAEAVRQFALRQAVPGK